jgi:hypothetical protein
MTDRVANLEVPEHWEIALCEPEAPPGPGCQPTVLSRYSRDNPTLYHGACFGCGWIGDDRDHCNVAVEDAHDHSHPGWRDLPIVEMPRRTADPKRDLRKLRAIELELRKIHPSDWPERCGPVRAWRDSPVASRHVPGYSPWGGFEMAVVREAGTASEPALLEQLSLGIS